MDIIDELMQNTVEINDDIYIGIDPGISGGLACITNTDLFATKCPSTIADMNERIEIISDIANQTGYRVSAVIEAVHSIPGQGVSSTWKFAQNYGEWLGILAGNKIPYTQVSPQKWMKWIGSVPKDKKARKNHIKHLAQQRYPDTKVTLATSDAIMIAEYCRYNSIATLAPTKDLD